MDLPDDCMVVLRDGEGREVDAQNTGGCCGCVIVGVILFEAGF
jgi:hypothetical protein